MNTETLEKAKDLYYSIKYFKDEIDNYKDQLEHAENCKTEKIDYDIRIATTWGGFDRKIRNKSLAIKILSEIISYYERELEITQYKFDKL